MRVSCHKILQPFLSVFEIVQCIINLLLPAEGESVHRCTSKDAWHAAARNAISTNRPEHPLSQRHAWRREACEIGHMVVPATASGNTRAVGAFCYLIRKRCQWAHAPRTTRAYMITTSYSTQRTAQVQGAGQPDSILCRSQSRTPW